MGSFEGNASGLSHEVVDSTTLKHYLQEGRYAIVDEIENLESRAGQRQSLAWLKKKSPPPPVGTSEQEAEK